MEKRRAIIIDIDGTIVDSTEAIRYLDGTKDKNNYPVYFRMLDKATPLYNTISEIKVYIRQKNIQDLIFLTSRNCDKYASFHTMSTIEQCFGEYFNQEDFRINVIYRALNDERPSKEMKCQKVLNLIQEFEILAIFEDEPDILEAYINMEGLQNSLIRGIITFPWFDYQKLLDIQKDNFVLL